MVALLRFQELAAPRRSNVAERPSPRLSAMATLESPFTSPHGYPRMSEWRTPLRPHTSLPRGIRLTVVADGRMPIRHGFLAYRLVEDCFQLRFGGPRTIMDLENFRKML